MSPRLRDVVSPAPRAEWQRIAACDGDSMVSQTADFVHAAAAGWGRRDGSRLYTFSDGRRAVLPAVAQGAGAVSRLASMPPAWGFGGLIADGPLTAHHVRAVLDDVWAAGHAQVHLRPNPVHAELWQQAASATRIVVSPGSAGVVDLSKGFDWVSRHGFSRTSRRKVRGARTAGIEIRQDNGDGALDAFLGLLRTSVARWAARDGEPVVLAQARRAVRDPRRKLAGLRDALGSGFRLYLAHLDGRAISGAIVLQGRHTAHYTRGAMDIDAVGRTGATQLLHHEAIRSACEAGCHTYHMGESAPGSGLEAFKSTVGARPLAYATYRLERVPLTAAERRGRAIARRVLVHASRSTGGQPQEAV